MGRLAALFAVDRTKFDLRRGIAIIVLLLVPFTVLGALHQQSYGLSVSFGALFVALSDPGGHIAYRIERMTVVGSAGALLTGLAFGLNGSWEWLIPATFVITLLAGFAYRAGRHALLISSLLNLWFVIAAALSIRYRLDHVRTHALAQMLAWLAGAAFMIVCSTVLALLRRRGEEPDGTAAPDEVVPTTRRAIAFAVARAVAGSLSVGIAFGLHLPYAEWTPISTLSALKPGLQQTTLMASQRVAGTIIGAGMAAAFLLAVDSRPVLSALIAVLGGLAGAVRAMSYLWFAAATAAAVLIAVDLPHPSDLTVEGLRILFTLIGVAIAVGVMLLGALIARTSAGSGSAPDQPGS